MADHPLPSSSIAPIAESVAKRQRTIATVWFVLAGVFFVFALTMVADPKQYPLTQSLGGGAFWVLVLAWIGIRARRKSAVMLAAGRTAASDPTISWYLRDLLLVAIDGSGAPRPDLSFKIRPQHRTMLSVLPVARALP